MDATSCGGRGGYTSCVRRIQSISRYVFCFFTWLGYLSPHSVVCSVRDKLRIHGRRKRAAKGRNIPDRIIRERTAQGQGFHSIANLCYLLHYYIQNLYFFHSSKPHTITPLRPTSSISNPHLEFILHPILLQLTFWHLKSDPFLQRRVRRATPFRSTISRFSKVVHKDITVVKGWFVDPCQEDTVHVWAVVVLVGGGREGQ